MNYPVVVFDAWANDFAPDPLIGFIHELEQALSSYYEKVPAVAKYMPGLMNSAKKLIKPMGMVMGSILVKQLTGYTLDAISDKVEVKDANADVDVLKVAELAMQEHASRRQALAQFKKSLRTLVDALAGEATVQLPIFIFVDELDRCRPDYAIELLEAIKHLFGVAGIYFVVATNRKELSNAICSVYGEKFDSVNYLKRFFDQEYNLPNPSKADFVDVLFERYSFDKVSNVYAAVDARKPRSAFHSLFLGFVQTFGLSLRDCEQVAVAMHAALLNWNDKRVHLPYLIFLLIVNHLNSDLFNQLRAGQLADGASFQEAVRKHTDLAEYRQGGAAYISVQGAVTTINELVWLYQKLAVMNAKEMWEAGNQYQPPLGYVFDNVQRDTPNQWFTHQVPPSSLADYADRASKAGHFA
jgi:hypothetical protein